MAEEDTLQESERTAGEDGDAASLQGAGVPVSDDADVEVEREEDAPPVAELDPETKARRDAALRHVRKLGDPVLRASALAVERFDEQLAAEIERMGELMHDALGVGLAATQLGVLHRVLVYQAHPENPVTALVGLKLNRAVLSSTLYSIRSASQCGQLPQNSVHFPRCR